METMTVTETEMETVCVNRPLAVRPTSLAEDIKYLTPETELLLSVKESQNSCLCKKGKETRHTIKQNMYIINILSGLLA